MALVPVSIRHPNEKGELGNRISTIMVRLPLSEPDPRKRLEQLRDETRRLKESDNAREGATKRPAKRKRRATKRKTVVSRVRARSPADAAGATSPSQVEAGYEFDCHGPVVATTGRARSRLRRESPPPRSARAP